MDTVVNTPVQTAANPVKQLLGEGQSPWLDFIRRSFIADGSLQKLVDTDGLGGVTSNPSIFEKAMGSGNDYDAEFKTLAQGGLKDAQEIYETMAVADIQAVAKVLHPVFERTKGLDGFVSLEVSPYLALRMEDTVTEARRLHAWVDRPNLMVKVPGTPECVPAIRTLISEGININVTLLFSNDAYKAVAEAYIAGLEDRHAKGEDISRISSVASFFVSRIDAQIDKKIDERVAAGDHDADALKKLRGRVAIANAKMAYVLYTDMVASDRWKKLAAAGANPQRLLWASTGVKDKAYSDVLYVEELVGRDTVDTIPPATMDAFRDHGKVRASLTENMDDARHVMAEVERLHLDLPGCHQATRGRRRAPVRRRRGRAAAGGGQEARDAARQQRGLAALHAAGSDRQIGGCQPGKMAQGRLGPPHVGARRLAVDERAGSQMAGVAGHRGRAPGARGRAGSLPEGRAGRRLHPRAAARHGRLQPRPGGVRPHVRQARRLAGTARAGQHRSAADQDLRARSTCPKRW